ncbi:hypothetical protein PoB_002117100 [Plakobranchus ocellatus]|uniref:Uncharacterized protein n=1 Tax=Plakobranchus ocellatus TaxID=259542 RepID=A0AAV3ZFJ7_9GAST|nr:hypothetical protein PoB_002117100 [Plakobranchus ocellatus]
MDAVQRKLKDIKDQKLRLVIKILLVSAEMKKTFDAYRERHGMNETRSNMSKPSNPVACPSHTVLPQQMSIETDLIPYELATSSIATLCPIRGVLHWEGTHR